MKYSGKIGFAISSETKPGIWNKTITERTYYGDVNRYIRKWESNQTINGNIDINNQISIIADPFACENFQHMVYISWMNALWKISSVEIQYPRMILTIGGVYNGETAE